MTIDAAQAFKFYGSKQQPLSVFLNLIPESIQQLILKNWTNTQKIKLVLKLSEFISRSEGLNINELKELFSVYEKPMNSFRKYKNLPEVNYAEQFLIRAAELRSTLVDFLTILQVDSSLLNSGYTTVSESIRFLKADNKSDQILLKLYFTSFWKERNEVIANLSAEGITVSSLRV